MARKKEAQTPAPTIVNSAPGYDPYARSTAPTPATGITAPGGPYGPPPTNGAVSIGPPQERTDQSPFINAAFLWNFGRPIKATIKGVRDATGTGKKEFNREGQAPKKGWFLDFVLENNTLATGRINEGDVRHQRLWAAFQASWVGRTVTLRITNPGDLDMMAKPPKPSRAPWMLDCS